MFLKIQAGGAWWGLQVATSRSCPLRTGAGAFVIGTGQRLLSTRCHLLLHCFPCCSFAFALSSSVFVEVARSTGTRRLFAASHWDTSVSSNSNHNHANVSSKKLIGYQQQCSRAKNQFQVLMTQETTRRIGGFEVQSWGEGEEIFELLVLPCGRALFAPTKSIKTELDKRFALEQN